MRLIKFVMSFFARSTSSGKQSNVAQISPFPKLILARRIKYRLAFFSLRFFCDGLVSLFCFVTGILLLSLKDGYTWASNSVVPLLMFVDFVVVVL